MSNTHRTRNVLLTVGLVLAGVVGGVLLTARMDWTAESQAQAVAPPVNTSYAALAGAVNETGESPFVAVSERVAPTVVNITSDRKVASTGDVHDFFRESPFWDWFNPNPNGDRDRGQTPRRREYHAPATGSGMIISRDGYILTNNHVVEDADKVTVKTQNGKEYDAEIVGKDPDTDVAVIKVAHSFDANEVALIGNSDNIKVGEWAIAMGNPLGLEWTLTVGIISARGRTNLAIQGGGPSYQDFIQTDASINFGNSGGPLCNIHGEVIGVNTAINPSGQGIGFAIPINMAMKVVKQLRETGSVARGYLGIRPRELTTALKKASGYVEDGSGVFVDMVEPGKPAAEGGMKDGDIITKFQGHEVSDVDQFRMLVADNPPGSHVSAEVYRDGQSKKLEFTLGDRKELASLLGGQGRGGRPGSEPEESPQAFLGVKVESISETLARALELDEAYGVVVTDVDPDGPAADHLQERDVIIELDRREVSGIGDYRDIVSSLKDTKKTILYRIIRDGNRTYVAVEPK